MCGLAGIIVPTSAWKDESQVFSELMWLTALRGMDSTGMMSLDKHGNTSVHKVVGSVAALAHTLPQQMDLSNPSLRSQMVHCRAATVGKVTIQNAHPFETDRYIGCHNGTMGGAEFLKPGKTDSQILIEAIQNEGFDEVMLRLKSEKFRHAYALTLYDKVDQKYIFYRNFHRPLFVATVTGWKGTLFWASEKEFFEFVGSRQVGVNFEIQRLEAYTKYVIDPWKSTIKSYKIGEEPKAEAVAEHKHTKYTPPIKDWDFCVDCQRALVGPDLEAAYKFRLNTKMRARCFECHETVVTKEAM